MCYLYSLTDPQRVLWNVCIARFLAIYWQNRFICICNEYYHFNATTNLRNQEKVHKFIRLHDRISKNRNLKTKVGYFERMSRSQVSCQKKIILVQKRDFMTLSHCFIIGKPTNIMVLPLVFITHVMCYMAFKVFILLIYLNFA